jgi:hypothetical protein
MEESQVKISGYTEAQKKATQRYREKNKDKVNEQRKKYYHERKEADPSYLEYKRDKARAYYRRKKSTGEGVEETEPVFVDIPVEDAVLEVTSPVVEPIEEALPVKEKKQRKKKVVIEDQPIPDEFPPEVEPVKEKKTRKKSTKETKVTIDVIFPEPTALMEPVKEKKTRKKAVKKDQPIIQSDESCPDCVC